MAASGTALGPGTLLGGRYRLERRIGGGGMASVWLATDGQLRRAVAVKVLSDALAGDPGYRARFRREAKVAARLSHPSLVRVFDTGDEDGRPYLVMEHVPGPTLAARIAAGERLDANRLASELLAALTHIHRAGIVHRDVKPANVLFDPAGRAKLTDFGIAQPADATRITQTGEVIGTLHYMAPEVAAGESATARSDLYATGVVLAEAAGEEATPQLRRLIDSLRATDPAERPISAEAAVARLDAAPTAPTVPVAKRRREIEIPLWAVLGALGAIAVAAIAVALIAGGGGGNGGGQGRGGNAGSQGSPAHTATSAARHPPSTPTSSTPTTTQAPPAPRPAKPPKEAKPAEAPKPPKEQSVPPGRAKHGLGPPPGHEKSAGGD
jgi:eukaryotic-like serine/threonine-protein kinase